MQLKFNVLLTYASAALFASTAVAAPISTSPNLIVFGNSLSDIGNTASLTHTQAYWEGRYSNSYVWNEYTAKLLGMNLVNNAYGGATSNNDLSPATSGSISIPSFHDQVVAWLKDNPSPSQYNLDNDVIEVEIGGNDVLYRVSQLLLGTVDVNDFASKLSASIAADVQLLVDAGYRNINLWNLPAVDKTPSITGLGAGALVKPVIAALNAAVKSAVEDVAAKSNASGIHVFDLNSLMGIALQSNVLAALGITDVTDACFTQDANGTTYVCPNPDEHFFYDGVHPASRMHYLWGVVASVLTDDPNTTIDASEVLQLVSTFAINKSNREDNIIVDGITPSQSSAIPPGEDTDTDTYSSATYTTPVYTTPVYPTVAPPISGCK
ncbi:hypothetical protein J3B02_001480 [Coemansia erecta]|uniref:Uncharacterized protein n=1 Tax=Coemansia asiatica TaxID=1052880 RepID=A0A9W8CI25_9FUNG|nr:hypothetical protein LPJ64_003589 [Coemansia asiatica]KAJ2856654.1 hypothetical protein J3B02_001480 [Coemansia erecta]KAJ2888582.1 hypothetical protein FB639_000541 [Coemansia asiatica]